MFPNTVTLWIVRMCATGIVLLLIWLWGEAHGAGKWKGKFETAVATHKLVLDDLAEKTAAAAAEAKRAAKVAQSERKANDERFLVEQGRAERAAADLAAALRAGRQRLQPWWTCPARPAEGDAAALAGGQDGQAELRAGSASRIVAAADRADRWIEWLQAELTSTRKACGVVD